MQALQLSIYNLSEWIAKYIKMMNNTNSSNLYFRLDLLLIALYLQPAFGHQ